MQNVVYTADAEPAGRVFAMEKNVSMQQPICVLGSHPRTLKVFVHTLPLDAAHSTSWHICTYCVQSMVTFTAVTRSRRICAGILTCVPPTSFS